MSTDEAGKPHMVAAIVVGWVLVTLVWAIFGFLAGNYVLYVPLLVAYAVWTVVSLSIFGRGLVEDEAH
jgi:hypothetical protein